MISDKRQLSTELVVFPILREPLSGPRDFWVFFFFFLVFFSSFFSLLLVCTSTTAIRDFLASSCPVLC
jgi:hypothetical protein